MDFRETNEFKRNENTSSQKISVSVRTLDLRQSDSETKNTIQNSEKLANSNLQNNKQEIKSEQLDPKRISFHKSNLNYLFPVPFISCISNITYAHKYQDYISLYAQITEQTKTYISNLVEQKNDDLKPSYIEEVNTKEFDLSINVSITILKNGKRSFDINETNYKWFISYVENEGNIFLSYRSEDILFTKEEIKENIFSGKVCSYCQCETKVVTNNGIYSPTFIQCSMNPDHYVGTYQSGIALGRLADRSLRQKITAAHSIFNSLLENKIFKSHEDAYAWLSNVMKLSEKETDFWLFNEEQSDNAIRIITRYKRRKKLIQSFFNFFKKE
jgi:hypothetical protein